MPNRRRFRGPRRPTPGALEGAPGSSAQLPQAEAAPGDGEMRTAGRRRRRGGRGRGTRPGSAEHAPGLPGEGEGIFSPERAPTSGPEGTFGERAPAGEGEEARRRRRRRGRGRRGDRPGYEGVPPLETAEGETPVDYIPLQVERGMPVLYRPETALEPAEAEDEPRTLQKSKRVNSGKLFWYIRSKSYVPVPELRRRFEITPDEVGTIQEDGQKIYIGLPQEVADVVANLRRQNKIGLECSVDFTTPVVIGVYPLNRS
ncbi:MAG TPA: hypothetical protein VF157_10085 [Chloroflexota bacterium]